MTAKEALERALKTQAPKQPTWAERFALKRRAIDRAILAEAEECIMKAPNPNACKFGGPNQCCVPGNCHCWTTGPDDSYLATWPETMRKAYQARQPEPPISFEGPSARQEREDARAAIARAFGRPLA